jgi:putative Ca2+/H+ antiporter (TMEM165/GDT1 family)
MTAGAHVNMLGLLAMAIWILIPDQLDDDQPRLARLGVFATTLLAFFLAEMGDKTQIATVALAARYQELAWVVVGTTAGMMIANVPAVLIGNRLADRLPVRLVHGIAALIFALLGIATLLGAGKHMGY